MERLLVRELKGATYRLLDLNTNKEIRAFERDFPEVDFIVGTLFECEYKNSGCLSEFTVINEILGDNSKERVELPIKKYSIGDVFEGVPILNFGRAYAKKGEKVAYAYFKWIRKKMNNNEIFLKILHLTRAGYDKENLIYIFKLGDMKASNSLVKGWRTSVDNERSTNMSDHALKCFFDGMFLYRNEQLKKGIKVFDFPHSKELNIVSAE